MTAEQSNDWNPELYDGKHSFVWKLAASVVELLNPRPTERILDVGCGTGQLTASIAESGACVIGIDNSVDMITEARRLFPNIEFKIADAHDFSFDGPFDAVFSNAALHWMREPEKVIGCIAQVLKPGGRLVVEFGGAGNVHCLVAALERASEKLLSQRLHHPWYFPSIAEFSTRLEACGLETTQAALIDRPTALEGDDGLRNWVRMFGKHWLSRVPVEDQDSFLKCVEDAARQNLQRDGIWYADHRRLRVVATKRKDTENEE